MIADDNAFIRRGIASLLSRDVAFEVCGEAANGAEALQQVDQLKPDVILLDISMPDLNGLDVARALSQKQLGLKIVIVSEHDVRLMLPRALQAGAHGCIDKSRLATDLLPSLRTLGNGTPIHP